MMMRDLQATCIPHLLALPSQAFLRKECCQIMSGGRFWNLGLPDDGYNYLLHLREIKNMGGGSSYLENPEAKFDRMPLDVKAYDASRLRINSEVIDDADKDMMYVVASSTRSVKAQKIVDPDVLRLLGDSDLSRFGSDDEDFEEDFEVKARAEEEDVLVADGGLDLQEQEVDGTVAVEGSVNDNLISDEKPRIRRLLDEQFDMDFD